jgi:hypothetical protein
MAEPVTIDELAQAMYQMVKESAGSRRLRPTELTKAMIERFGADRCSRDACKEALRKLIDSEQCVYTFYSGSFVELPSKESGGSGA